jgi:hypothetical protein
MGSGGPDPRAVGGFLIVAFLVGEYRFLVVEHSIEIYGAPARTFGSWPLRDLPSRAPKRWVHPPDTSGW